MLEPIKKLLHNRIISSLLIVGSISILVKVVAFYKEVLIASTFGLSMILDTFLIAILIPNFIRRVFVGSLNNVFIPNYILEIKENGDLGSFQAIVYSVITGIMLVFMVLIYFTFDVFVEIAFPNKSDEYYNLIKDQLVFVLPSLLFMGFSTVLSGLLEIKGKFFLANIGSFLFPVTTILFILFAREQLGNLVLAVAFLCGTFLTFTYLLIQSLRIKSIYISKPIINKNSRTMLKQVPHKMTAGFFSGSNTFIDQYFAAQLVVGSIAAINYGGKIPKFTLSLIILAIGKVLLPHFSKLVAKNINKAFETLFKTMKISFAISLVTCILVFIFTPTIISALFERNQFSAEDTQIVSNLQRILLIYIPFALVGTILTKFLTTLNENKYMAKVSFFSFLLNIALNILLMEHYGLYGLAMSSTLVFTIRFFIYFRYTLKIKKERLLNEF